MKLQNNEDLNYMYQNLFPITIIDDFYPQPDIIRNFALSQNFESSENGGWPGKRTKDIDLLDLDLYNFFVKSIMNVFYPMEFEYGCNLETSFQLIECRDKDQYSSRNRGWIHHDAVVFGGVVYLTKDPEPDTGTSIYRPKYGHHQHKQEWVEAKGEDYSREGKNITPERHKEIMNEQYDRFEESVAIENVYNRCVLFGGNVMHAAKTFGTRSGKDARLTQVFFCHNLNSSMDTYPLCRPYTAG